MVCHLFEGVPTDLPRADELLLPMYNFFLRSIVPRTLNELKITKLLMFSFSNVCSPDLASLMVGAPNLATDPRTRRHRLLRCLVRDCQHFYCDNDFLHQIAHLRFWRDVEAKKTRVSVVVAALLVLVDLLLKHSQSSTEHATTIKFTTVII